MNYPKFDSHFEFLKYFSKLHAEYPDAVRMDLRTENDTMPGNLKIAAIFYYPESKSDQSYKEKWAKWKVHFNTKFAPLIEAQKLIKEGNDFPFEPGPTITGKGTRLNLIGGSGATPGLYIFKMK